MPDECYHFDEVQACRAKAKAYKMRPIMIGEETGYFHAISQHKHDTVVVWETDKGYLRMNSIEHVKFIDREW